MEDDKSRNPLTDRLLRSGNRGIRVVGFLDFRKEVESGVRGLAIWRGDMSWKKR